MSCLMSRSIHCLFSLSPNYLLSYQAFSHSSINKGTSSSHFPIFSLSFISITQFIFYVSLLHVFQLVHYDICQTKRGRRVVAFLRRSKHRGNIKVSCRMQSMLQKHTKLNDRCNILLSLKRICYYDQNCLLLMHVFKHFKKLNPIFIFIHYKIWRRKRK